MNTNRRASLSFLLMGLMVLTSFTVLASTPAVAEQGPVSESNTGAMDSDNPLAGLLSPELKVDPVLKERMTTAKDPLMVYVAVTDRTEVNSYLVEQGLPQIRGKEFDGIPTIRMMELTPKQIYTLAEFDGVQSIKIFEKPYVEPDLLERAIEESPVLPAPNLAPPATEDYDVNRVHGAVDAWMEGWTGENVKIAVIDDGFDFAHPDLQGAQARYVGGPYDGWPIAYDDFAALLWSYDEIGGWVADTSTTVQAYGDYVYFDGARYKVDGLKDVLGNPITSLSGNYHIGYHPDQNLVNLWGGPVAVLVVDATSPWSYDTVFVDVTHDFDFTNDKACTKGDEISYFDSYDAVAGSDDFSNWDAGDGFADYSGGMVYWISDGSYVLPGSDWTYGATFTPDSGDAVALMGAFYADQSHGTMTASAALARGVTLGGQLGGMAPDASLIAIPFTGSITNAWLFAEFGADGLSNSGDEANIVSNSYGWSDTAITAGYEEYDVFATEIAMEGYYTLWCWSAGNGGPGYGTAHSPVVYPSIHVGAGTTMQYRYLLGYEVAPGYQKWGDVIPFSNSGPTRTGKLNAEIIASGAYSLEPMPLNMFDNYGSLGDGSMHFQIGSGTSHATPTVAGGAALGYEAWYDGAGGWPPMDMGKAFLMAAADDMHFDPLKQGAGWLNAYTFSIMCAEWVGSSVTEGTVATIAFPGMASPTFSTSAFYPGGMYGDQYEMWPNFMYAGEYDDTHTFMTLNYDPLDTHEVNITAKILLKTGSDSLTFTTASAGSLYEDITAYVPAETDLLKVTMYTNMSTFDPDGDYVSDITYWLELHDWVDLDGDGEMDVTGGEWELFRYSVDGSDCNYNQIMIKDPIDRTTDGLIARIRAVAGQVGIDIHLQLDYYELRPFDWVRFMNTMVPSPWTLGIDMTVNPHTLNLWAINVSVPADVPVGTYAAAVYIDMDSGTRVQCLPIVINVPSKTYEFAFGGPSYFDTPYNNDVTGVADKGWRFEVGDWRMYYILPEDWADFPDLWSHLVVSVNWTDPQTDVNAHVLGAVYNYFSVPSFQPPYGPGQMGVPLASSDEKYMGAGTFGHWTSTGGPSEVIAVPNNNAWLGANGFTIPFAEWLSLLYTGLPSPVTILTRCPIMGGSAPSETIEGFTKWVTMVDVQPTSVEFSSLQPGSPGDPGYVPLADKIPGFYEILVDGTVEVTGGGVQPVMGLEYPMETIWQDDLSGSFVEALANAEYTMPFVVEETSRLVVHVEEVSDAPDIDLGLWKDEDMDGIADLDEPYWYVGAGGSDETLTLEDPEPGNYLVKVLGYTVTGMPGYFSLSIMMTVEGAIIEVTDYETTAGTGVHEFNISYSLPPEAGIYSGAATFGVMGASDMFSIPVTIEVIDAGAPVIENVVPADGAILATNIVTVEFDVNDSVEFYSGLDQADIFIDGYYYSHIATFDGDHVSLTLPYALAQGEHTLVIDAWDLYGNAAETVTVVFTIDSVIETFEADFVEPASMIVIPDGGTVALDTVDILGWTDPDSTVTASTPFASWSTVADGAGYFEFLGATLEEGVNVFTITTENPAGIMATMYKTIISDTVCLLTVDPAETPVATATVTLTGQTEMGAGVAVDGNAATVLADGSWSADVSLTEGTNVFTVEATDSVGNVAIVEVTIVLDTTPPSLSIAEPASGTTVHEASVLVSGTVEAGATVWVNGVVASDGSTAWSAVVVLAEGDNTVTVTAADALGNDVTLTRTVTYEPPYATPEDLDELQDQMEDLIDGLNDSVQQDLDDMSGDVQDTQDFANLLMYLTLGLFVAAIIIVVLVWYILNGKMKGGSSSASHSMEEVEEPPSPSDVEKEFEQLEKEISREEGRR